MDRDPEIECGNCVFANQTSTTRLGYRKGNGDGSGSRNHPMTSWADKKMGEELKAIVLATNASISVDTGNIYIIHRLRAFIRLDRVRVFIVYPSSQSLDTLQAVYQCVADMEFIYVSAPESSEDPYFIQLGICEVFLSLRDEDRCLYLDYDHVIADDSFAADLFELDKTLIGSEVTPYRNRSMPELSSHYNTSLLYGIGRELRKIGNGWHEAYNSVKKATDNRNRTEIALTYLVHCNEIEISPCPIHLQSSLAVSCASYKLFHYGGRSPISCHMKSRLSDFQLSLANKQMLDKSVDQITEEFVTYLGKIA